MREQTNSLFYFSLDVDFFTKSRKIKILKARYGADGLIIYLYLLCQIYGDKGYYLQTDDDFYYMISEELNMSSEKIRQVLNFLLGRSLFHDKLFKSDKVLTSPEIQRRYLEGIKSRAQKNTRLVERKYWLLQEEETPKYIQFYPATSEIPEQKSSENNNSENFADNSRKKEENSEKQNINKNKEKKSKVKEIDTRTRAGESAHREAPIAEIYALYNQICVSLPKVSLTAPNSYRERAVREIWEAYQDMDKIKRVFENAEASDFLGGKIPGKNWIASFDWIMRQENFVKIYEGNYSRNNSQGKTFEQQSASYDLEALEHYWENVPIVDQN